MRRRKNIYTEYAEIGFLDFISDAFDDIGDAISSIPVVGGVLSDLGDDFKSFAGTTFGKAFLVVITTYVTGGLQSGLTQLIGPIGAQVGTVAFALPGVSAGQTFGASWTSEFVSRTEQLVSIVGPGIAGQFVAQYGQQLADQFTALAKAAGFDPSQLAQYAQQLQSKGAAEIQALADACGVRADVLQSMIDYASGQLNMQTSPLTAWANLSAAQQTAVTAGYKGLGIATDAASAQALYEENRVAESAKRAFDPTTGKIIMSTTTINTGGIHLNAPTLLTKQATASEVISQVGVAKFSAAAASAKTAPTRTPAATVSVSPTPTVAELAVTAHPLAVTPMVSPTTFSAKKVAVGGGIAAVLGAALWFFV